MTVAARKRPSAPAVLYGRATPRVAPPLPLRTGIDDFRATATTCGIALFPWQESAGRYLTALGPAERWLYREVALIVARQNGKTRLLIPLIVSRLLVGRRIMHTAQNRELPREVFGEVADVMWRDHRGLLTRRPRFANGQEEIRLRNGGIYRIVAPTRGGARGPSNDDVIIDELREMTEHDFIAAAKPTLTASANPQMIYLSNAGTDESEVLNALKKRADEDPALAYLEWSAAPERAADELAGWLEANPAVGHIPMVLPNLESEYRAHRLAGTLGIFETEHLCRWVVTLATKVVTGSAWLACHGATEEPSRPALGMSMDGGRIAAVIAWLQSDGRVGCRELAPEGDPSDVEGYSRSLRALAASLGVRQVAFGSWTDTALSKAFPASKALDGRDFANASENFARIVAQGRLVWSDAPHLTDELHWTARKSHESGAWTAVGAAERSIPTVLAAIRAVWFPSLPKPAAPRIG